MPKKSGAKCTEIDCDLLVQQPDALVGVRKGSVLEGGGGFLTRKTHVQHIRDQLRC